MESNVDVTVTTFTVKEYAEIGILLKNLWMAEAGGMRYEVVAHGDEVDIYYWAGVEEEEAQPQPQD